MDGQEIKLKPGHFIVSKTDTQGRILSFNKEFLDISGYSGDELKGSPHNILRHPDMPELVFKLLWLKIRDGQTVKAFVKNRTKDRRHYWVYANVEPVFDQITGKIKGYCSIRKNANPEAIKEIEEIYAKLASTHQKEGYTAAKELLCSLLLKKGMKYNDLISGMQMGHLSIR